MERVCLRPGCLEYERVAALFDADAIVAPRQRAQRALDRNFAGADIHFDLGRQLDGVVADPRHLCVLRQATMQSTSPPTPVARALRSVITPREVETIAMPIPFMTRGMASLLL